MKKIKVGSILLCFVMLFSLTGAVYADSNTTTASATGQIVQTYVVPESQVQRQIQENMDNYITQLNNEANGGIAPKSEPPYIWKTEDAGSQTATNVKIGWANGQPANGTVFPTAGSGFYWNDNSGTSVSISFSVTYGPFSVSVSPGSTGGNTGYFAQIPASYVNRAVKLQVNKDLTVYRRAVYRAPYLDPNNWVFQNYTYTTVPTRYYLNVKLAN